MTIPTGPFTPKSDRVPRYHFNVEDGLLRVDLLVEQQGKPFGMGY